jgi:hypothetical protein
MVVVEHHLPVDSRIHIGDPDAKMIRHCARRPAEQPHVVNRIISTFVGTAMLRRYGDKHMASPPLAR